MKRLKKMPKLILLSAISAIAFGGIAAGSTYALFTSSAETKTTVTAGKVSLTKNIDNIELYSLVNGTQTKVDSSTTEFTSGATFNYDTTTGAVTLDKFLPGDKVTFKITITNESNVNIKYRTVYKVLEDKGLFNGLKVTVGGVEFDGYTTESNFTDWDLSADKTKTLDVSIELPEEADSQYSARSTSFSINAEAIQGNAKTETVDTTTFKISNHIDLVAFAKRLNSGVFSYTKVELTNDIDMKDISYPSPAFKADYDVIFEGNSHTIYNFTPSQTKDTSNIYTGLIGHINANNLTINNVNFETATVKGSYSDPTYFVPDTCKENPAAGVVVGFADTGCSSLTLSNVSVKDIAVSNTKYAGGLIGYTSCTTNISGCKFEVSEGKTNTITGYTAGGIIGQVGGKDTTINNITLSGKVLASGYKREGGLVGTVSGTSLTITNLNEEDASTYLSISGNAISAKGTYVGLTNTSTTINGSYYYTVSNDADLQAINANSSSSSYIIELGEGTYNGYSAKFKNVIGGVRIIGRGDLDKIIWVQVSNDSANSCDSFNGTNVTMSNVTITSNRTSDGHYTGFVHAGELNLNNCKIKVKNKTGGGVMGHWGSKVTFDNCTFETKTDEGSYEVDDSNLFTYSGTEYNFKNCTFYSYESAIKLYREKATTVSKVYINISNCTFQSKYATEGGASLYKSAITMHMDDPVNDYTQYIVTIDGISYDDSTSTTTSKILGNYAKGASESYKKLIGFKKNNDSTVYYLDQIKITVNNQKVTDLGLSNRS